MGHGVETYRLAPLERPPFIAAPCAIPVFTIRWTPEGGQESAGETGQEESDGDPSRMLRERVHDRVDRSALKVDEIICAEGYLYACGSSSS